MAVWVPGEPVLSGGRGQDEWQAAIRTALGGREIRNPSLTFVVAALRRWGNPFDLDNLIHPVLMVLDEPIDVVTARLYVGSQPGLLLEDSLPPLPEPVRSLYVSSHSKVSARTRPGILELVDDEVLSDHEGLGLSLEFDRADIPIRRGWFGPTEAVVDDLKPWFGTYTTRELIADHRIRHVRFQRGINPEAEGVRISVWYVPDQDMTIPPDVASRMQAVSRS